MYSIFVSTVPRLCVHEGFVGSPSNSELDLLALVPLSRAKRFSKRGKETKDPRHDKSQVCHGHMAQVNCKLVIALVEKRSPLEEG